MVLAAVLAEALKQHGNRAPSSVVLTHPVSWKSSRRAASVDALNAAATQLQVTLPAPALVEEPVAAAHWFAQSPQSHEGDHFAVYDLGGGTFDAAVLARHGAEFEVVASGAIDDLGGFEFDNLLFTHLGDTHIGPVDPQLWSRIVAGDDASVWDDRRGMQDRVKHLKEMLTDSPTKRIRLPAATNQVVVTLGDFNDLIDKLIKKTVVELEATVARANLRLDQLSAVYRIGAAARTPLVGTMLDQLQVLVRTEGHPKLVVAQGGAIIAHRAMLALDQEPDHDDPDDEPDDDPKRGTERRCEAPAAAKRPECARRWARSRCRRCRADVVGAAEAAANTCVPARHRTPRSKLVLSKQASISNGPAGVGCVWDRLRPA